MKLVFRVAYHTVPGESLWLVLRLHDADGGLTLRETTAMQWRDPEHWETQLEVDARSPLDLEYHYQLRRENNGAVLDEWNVPRLVRLDPTIHEAQVRIDDWCSAGTVDYLYETRAFPPTWSVPPAPAPCVENATHHITLHMAAVPEGQVPCILGGIPELGDWDWKRAIPLAPSPTTSNLWETHLNLPTDTPIEFKFGISPWRGHLARSLTCTSLECGENRVLGCHQYAQHQLTTVTCERYHRDGSQMIRSAGVAVPVFSLRSEKSLGIGEFADLIPFADWAADVGFKLIQILPINDTTSAKDWTDSYPYSAISVFALHPAYLRLTGLHLADLPKDLARETAKLAGKLNALSEIDHEAVMAAKTRITRAIFDAQFAHIIGASGFQCFLAENRDWVVPYAAFCVLRDEFRTADFRKWRKHAIFRPAEIESWADPAHPRWPAVAYHIWLQFELDFQLAAAVAHLHARGIALKGDLPIGIDRESVDAWSAPHLFHLDAQTGAPPDAFAVKGQNWGFPTYNWGAMRADGFAWWRARFAKLSRYFDAYRIDHILGFFRIWQIPIEHSEGIMGYFDPANPIHLDEIRGRGIDFDFDRHCRPFIHESHLVDRFGPETSEAKNHYLEACGNGCWKLRDDFATQRRIESHFADWDLADPASRARAEKLRQGLLDCAAEVLFLEHPGSDGTRFHPRYAMYRTRSFGDLPAGQQEKLINLSNDYFYHRQEGLWEAHALELLPIMRAASPMLLCGEDLGMVPACLPAVLRELGILSLEIQRMPKTSANEFLDPAQVDYLSVVSPSTHDMPTLRMWWREDAHATARFVWQFFHQSFPPADLDGETAERIVRHHLESPAMWAVIPIQDLLAMDESLRRENPDDERINIPAIMPYYWRYRLHLDTEALAAAAGFNRRLREIISRGD
ncbi:MAG: 4-alpha-glucanotransferase [Luteolibacter sp.]